MSSPLEQINMTELDANEYCTSQRIIYSALTERINISHVRGNGTFSTSGSNNPGNYRNYYPFASKVGWYGNAGEPFIPLSISENAEMVTRSFKFFISKQSIIDLEGTNNHELARWNTVIGNDSPWDYLGVADETPEFTIPCKEVLEILYNFITECLTYVVTANIADVTRNLDIRVKGIFADVAGTLTTKNRHTYAQGDNAIDADILDPVSFGANELLSTSGYTNFPLTTSAENSMCYINVVPKDWNGTGYDDFQIEAKYIQLIRILDYTDIKNSLTITGLPLSAKYYVNYQYSAGNPVDGVDYEQLLEEDISHSVSGNIIENALGIPEATSLGTIPALPAPLASFGSYGFRPLVYLEKRSNGIVELFENNNVFHDWDGEGGFEYYTPPAA